MRHHAAGLPVASEHHVRGRRAAADAAVPVVVPRGDRSHRHGGGPTQARNLHCWRAASRSSRWTGRATTAWSPGWWRRWWTLAVTTGGATAPPTGSHWARPAVEVAWTGTAVVEARRPRRSWFILWSGMRSGGGAFPISRSRAHTHRRHGHPLQTVPSAGLIERPQEKNRVDALR